MIFAALIALAPAASAVDAELAFARDARRIGQWTAFRKWSDPDAVMFTPQAVWARSFLKTLKDPPRSITWRPAETYSSCDGRTAINIGPWFTQDDRLGGYFTTVWQRTPAGWRWVYDGGIPVRVGSRAKSPKSERASCAVPALPLPTAPLRPLKGKTTLTTPDDRGRGASADRTLAWDWKVSGSGERTFRVFMWNGARYSLIIDAIDPAPKVK